MQKWKYLGIIAIIGVLIISKSEIIVREKNEKGTSINEETITKNEIKASKEKMDTEMVDIEKEDVEKADKKKADIKKADIEKADIKNTNVTKAEEDNEMNEFWEKDSFTISRISEEISARITGKSYKENPNISLEELCYIQVLHYDFDGKIKEGELIVNKTIAEDIIDIFKELFEKKYPIEKISLIDEYDADDDSSMTDNNTSGFNYRMISGTQSLSKHSLGLAIDINPLYNPYVKEGKVLPNEGKKYADRALKCEYYIDKDDLCYELFIEKGFTWGGEWNSSKDYQHFEKE